LSVSLCEKSFAKSAALCSWGSRISNIARINVGSCLLGASGLVDGAHEHSVQVKTLAASSTGFVPLAKKSRLTSLVSADCVACAGGLATAKLFVLKSAATLTQCELRSSRRTTCERRNEETFVPRAWYLQLLHGSAAVSMRDLRAGAH
jgi:hypothetical protein